MSNISAILGRYRIYCAYGDRLAVADALAEINAIADEMATALEKYDIE